MPFTLVDEFPAHPRSNGTCFTCHTARRPKDRLVDLGVTTDEIVDLDGNIHGFTQPTICESCILELATMMGCIAPNKVQELGARLISAEDERDRLRTKLNQLAADFLEDVTT